MRILFVFGSMLKVGGHFKSAQALAKGLHAKGHQVFIFVQGNDDRLCSEFEKVHVMVFRYREGIADQIPNGKFRTLFRTFSLTRQLIKLIKRNQIDTLHCQDSGFIRYAYLAGCLIKKKLVCTQAGGEFINHLHPLESPLIVYSEELQEAYGKLNIPFRPREVVYLRERIDMDLYHPGEKDRTLLNAHNIPLDATVFLMIIRLHIDKKPWIDAFFRLADSLIFDGSPLRFVLMGEGDLYENVVVQAEHFNVLHDERKILPLGGIPDACQVRRWILTSDILVGNGRGPIEGMACGRAAMVAGERGELELITTDNIEKAAHWNFSGRHFRGQSLDSGGEKLHLGAVEIANAAISGQEYVRKNYDAYVGAEKLEAVYQKTQPCRLMQYVRWEIFRIKNRSLLCVI